MAVRGTIERAFLLAPQCRTIAELRSRLKAERYENVEAHISGTVLKQLNGLLDSSR